MTYRFKTFKLLFPLFISAHISCATITEGPRQTISINSNPIEADVYINGEFFGKTPLDVDLMKNKNTYRVKIKKEGYLPENAIIDRSFNPTTLGNVLLLSLAPIGLALDLLNYSAWTLSPTHQNFRLIPKSAEKPSTQTASTQYELEMESKKPIVKSTLSGPRVGFTYLDDNFKKTIFEEKGIEVSNFLTQFGWQFEYQTKFDDVPFSLLYELVPMIGGLDQNTLIPSLSGIIGTRYKDRFEVGLGPNFVGTSSAIVYTVGYNFDFKAANIPVNLAVTPSQHGNRYTILTGINW